MGADDDAVPDGFVGVGDVDPDDFRAGRHEVADRHTVEGHDAFDHGGFLGVKNSGAGALEDEEPDFFFRELELFFSPLKNSRK